MMFSAADASLDLFFRPGFSVLGLRLLRTAIVLTIILVNTYLFIYWSPFHWPALPHFNPSTVSVWIDKSNIHKSSILTQRIWEIPQPNVNVGSLLNSFFFFVADNICFFFVGLCVSVDRQRNPLVTTITVLLCVKDVFFFFVFGESQIIILFSLQ